MSSSCSTWSFPTYRQNEREREVSDVPVRDPTKRLSYSTNQRDTLIQPIRGKEGVEQMRNTLLYFYNRRLKRPYDISQTFWGWCFTEPPHTQAYLNCLMSVRCSLRMGRKSEQQKIWIRYKVSGMKSERCLREDPAFISCLLPCLVVSLFQSPSSLVSSNLV